MGKVVSSAAMSLDGFVAKEDNSIGRLFDWLQSGDVELPTVTPGLTFRMSPVSAKYWQEWMDQLGALICGRTLFDVTDGWNGQHTMDVPVVVLTHEVPKKWVDAHPDAPFHFVTTGIADAVAKAQEIAGDRVVAVTGGVIAKQALELGLLDQVAIDLVPVVMGSGRPYFGDLDADDVLLADPTVHIQGDQVTHLVFPAHR